VAYRGSAPAISDLIGGHLPFAIVTIADAIPQHRAGTVKILAVPGRHRQDSGGEQRRAVAVPA
jgi:tripartite-type tricarboxylate transporter receptor subunit TctC